MSNPSDAWTEERLASLATMSNWRPKAIWEAMNRLPGPPLTKNAVAGKYYRMFGCKKPKKTESEKAASREAARLRDVERKRERRANDKSPVQAISRGPKVASDDSTPSTIDVVTLDIRLVDLTNSQCRFASVRIDDEWRFCGHPKRAGSSFCEQHHAAVWHPRVAPTKQRSLFRERAAA